MRTLRNVSLKAKMLIGSAFSVTVILLLALAYYLATSKLSGASQGMAHASRLLYAQGMADMMHDAIKADVLHVLMLRQRGEDVRAMRAEFAEHVTTLRRSLDQIKQQAYEPRIVESLGIAFPDAMDYVERAQRAIGDSSANFGSHEMSGFLESYTRLEESMGALGETIDGVIAGLHAASEQTLTLVTRGFSAILAIGCLGVLAVAASSASINRRLGQLVRSVQGIADDETDLSRRIEIGESQDEVGIAAHALNKYLDAMTHIVESLRQASTRLHAAVGNMNYLAGETRAQVVTAGNSIEHATGAAAQVAMLAASVAGSAQQSAQSTDSANTQSQAGSEVVSGSMHSITALTLTIEQAAGVVQDLNEHANRMGSLLAVIRSVADQTNLLALNAAIEAARAGEYGRGFAVVADEVRKLALRTSEATGEIGGMITTLQEQVRLGVNTMHDGLEKANQCRQSATSAGETFNRIAGSVGEITAMNQAVAESARAQNAATEELNLDMARVNEVAQRAVALSDEIMLAAQQANQVAEDVESTVMRFRTAKTGESTAAVELF